MSNQNIGGVSFCSLIFLGVFVVFVFNCDLCWGFIVGICDVVCSVQDIYEEIVCFVIGQIFDILCEEGLYWFEQVQDCVGMLVQMVVVCVV